MATTKNTATKAKETKIGKDEKTKEDAPPHDSVRETIESVVIAFVLAFLFRTFEAEAFVIPTGSMAPTLMGQHKDLECAACKFPYRVNASKEERRTRQIEDGQKKYIEQIQAWVASSECPNCRYRMPMKYDGIDDWLDVQEKSLPVQRSYAGDRLLVSKFSYEFEDPKRWDVVVFKYPGRAQNNYIKRLVGLPRETVIIKRGDIYTISAAIESGSEELQRKPPDKVLAMLQTVYDNDYVLADWIKAKWPACWHSVDEGEAGWTRSDDCKSFSTAGKSDAAVWLRYRHIVPTADEWSIASNLAAIEALTQKKQPDFIRDFYGYNSGELVGKSLVVEQDQSDRIIKQELGPVRQLEAPEIGRHWVGDLAVEFEIDLQDTKGHLSLELVKGGQKFAGVLDLENGTANLAIPSLKSYAPKAQHALHGVGKHQIRFANVDEQLLLWVDDKLVQFDSATTYPSLDNYRPVPADLAPVGIAVQGTACAVRHLRVLRDVYYIANPETSRGIATADEDAEARKVYPLKEDQFFMLGDNSPKSSDGRYWASEIGDPSQYYVHRDLLIGKAVYIYWPHGLAPDWSLGVSAFGRRYYIPFYPNFWRMGLVR